jgi:putative phage-type endonuclease
MLTKEQLEARKNYLGGSDLAAILGLSRWKTALEIWGEKTGELEPEDISEKLHIRVGNKLEQSVGELFTEETGLQIEKVDETFFHPTHKFLGANIDRKIVGKDEGLEIKTASSWKLHEWDDENIPQEYYLQCMWYLAMTGLKKWHIICLIGNSDLKIVPIERDEDLIKSMIEKAVEFWTTYVIPKVMPFSISYKDSDVLFKLFPEAIKSEVEFGPEVDAEIDSLEAMKAESKSLEASIEKAENELKARLKENESGRTPCHIFTWKNQTRVGLDTKRIKEENPAVYKQYAKETNFRVFRISERKEK